MTRATDAPGFLDEIQRVWATIDVRGIQLRAPLIYEKAEWPDTLSGLSDSSPIVLSRVDSYSPLYARAISADVFRGVSEFHVSAGKDKKKIPELMHWYKRIRDAAAANVLLSGKVDFFNIEGLGDSPAIEGPLEVQYADEPPHWAFLVRWFARIDVSSAVTVGDPSVP